MKKHLFEAGPMKKYDFELKVVQLVPAGNLTYRPYDEDGTKLTLYYLDGKHIATHTAKRAFIFDNEATKPLPPQ